MAQIFISYSRKDIDFVRRLAGDLEKAGYDVWWDLTDLRGGDDWPRVIPSAIESSQFVIVVLSPNSVISDWVEKEYMQAISLRKKIIPIMLTQSRVPFALNTINYIDFTDNDYDASLNKLLSALEYSGSLSSAPRGPLAVALRTVQTYALPIAIAILVILAIVAVRFLSPPAAVPAPTQQSTPSALPSQTPSVIPITETVTPTASPTVSVTHTPTLTSTATQTPTLEPTVTPSPTNQPFDRLGLCVQSDYANSINVRSGPGTIYAPLGDPLLVGTCLFFSARNEESTWLQIAPNQADPSFQQYEGGWIFRELLGLGMTRPVDLPAVTLTPTLPPSETPTLTPTFTRTPTSTMTPSETVTDTPVPTETETPTP